MAMFDGADVCATCEADLDGGRTVQVYASAFYAFCSERCFAAALAKQKKQRWAARRRAAKVLVLAGRRDGRAAGDAQPAVDATDGVAAGPCSPRPRRARRRCPRVGSAPTGRPPRPACWRRWATTPGCTRWRAPSAACPAATRACSARAGRETAPSNAATATAASTWAARSGASTSTPFTTASSTSCSAGRTRTHGGRFVRISHRNGTVFTQYFHLAADPARARARRAREGRRRRRPAGRQRRQRVGAAPPLRDLDQAVPGWPREIHGSGAAHRAVAAARTRRRRRVRAW